MFAIAQLTIGKIKEPAFFMMLIIACLLGYSISEMDPLSQQLTGNIVSNLINAQKGHPLQTSTLFAFCIAALIAIFAGATDIPRDINTRMIMLLISKPIHKSEYLFGKYLGILGLCCIFFVSIEVTIVVAHLIKAGELYSLGMLIRQFMMLLALFPLVGLTVMISCFMEDFPAMIITSIYLVFALSVSTIPLLVEMLPASIGIHSYLFIIYYFFPNFLYYFQGFQIIGLITVALLVYSAAITTVFLTIANYRLLNRDLI